MTEVGDIYLTVFWWTLGTLAVAWVVLAALIALHVRTVPSPGSEASHSTFDVLWAVAPVVIVMLVAVPAVRGTFGTDRSPEGATRGAAIETVEPRNTDTKHRDAETAATSVTGPSELPAVACETVRQGTKTEEDDTEEDDIVK